MPSQFEDAILRHTIELNEIIEHGIQHENGTLISPWRIEGERKVVGIGKSFYYSTIIRTCTCFSRANASTALGVFELTVARY